MKNHISEQQLQANLANSKFSTGPKTAEGKRKVRLNAVSHGYSGHACFIPEHEQEAFAKHFQGFRADYRPKGKTEEFLVQSLAQLSWSAEQIRATAQTLLSMLGTQSSPFDSGDDAMSFHLAQAANLGKHLKEIDLLSVYEQRKMRLFHTTRRELEQLQKQRKALETEEITEAALIRKAYPAEWQPADDGFACSIEEIDRFIARQDRLTTLQGGRKMTN